MSSVKSKATRTKRTPPIVVDPNVERLMKGDMIAIRDMILGHVAAVSNAKGVQINEVRIMLRRDVEDPCWEEVAFDINLAADMETAFEYWSAVSNAVGESGKIMTEKMQDTLSGHAAIGVSGDDFTTFF